MKLSQTGTDKNPLQNRIPGITHILQLVMTIPSLISYYAVKVRRRELRAPVVVAHLQHFTLTLPKSSGA
jgi:hypothetical protein